MNIYGGNVCGLSHYIGMMDGDTSVVTLMTCCECFTNPYRGMMLLHPPPLRGDDTPVSLGTCSFPVYPGSYSVATDSRYISCNTCGGLTTMFQCSLCELRYVTMTTWLWFVQTEWDFLIVLGDEWVLSSIDLDGIGMDPLGTVSVLPFPYHQVLILMTTGLAVPCILSSDDGIDHITCHGLT